MTPSPANPESAGPLRELISKWREMPSAYSMNGPHSNDGFHFCANELESILPAIDARIQQAVAGAYGMPALASDPIRPAETSDALEVPREELERQKREREYWEPLVEQARESGRQEAYAATERHLLGTEALPEGFHTAYVIKRHDARVEARARLEEAKWWRQFLPKERPDDANRYRSWQLAEDRIAQLEAEASK